MPKISIQVLGVNGKHPGFPNGDMKSVTCHQFQSKSEHLSKMADGVVMLAHAQSCVNKKVVWTKRGCDRRDYLYRNRTQSPQALWSVDDE